MAARVYCSVYGCLNSTLLKPTLSFFKLPADAERRSEWLRLISRDDLLNKPHRGYSVCEDHFDEHVIIPGSRRKNLKKTALPTLNLPNLQKKDQETQTMDLTEISNIVKTKNTLSVITPKTTQTARSLSANTSSKRKLMSDLSECRKKLKLYDVDFQTQNVQIDTFHKLCDRFLTKELAMLVKAQNDLKFNHEGNRYHQDYIIFCLNLHYTSPQAYRLLQSALCMPCASTLSKHYIPITTKIHEKVMLALKIKVENMSEQEKNCSVVVNAMSLKANLFYDINADKIIGFHDIEGEQTAEPAKNALVVIVRGIFINWKQPIAFALLSECQNNDKIAKWIHRLLRKLTETGLNIRTFVSDTGSDLLKAAKQRLITVEKPYFFINHRKIYYIFDAPHLLKSVCNNLMHYDFHFNGKVAKYEHILKFYNQDREKNFKLARKLTNSHINPSSFEKMKVCHATQLLSNTVASGIATYMDFKYIDGNGRDTVELVKLMNNLFDALNSSTLKADYEYKRAFYGEELQKSFFHEMLLFFRNLKLINSKNGHNVTSNIKFIQGFQITIKSILLLFEDLKSEGYNFLFTRRLNLDVIENLFGQIRTKNGISTEPTSRQFISAFRKLYFSNMIKPPKGGNCPDDLGKVLFQSDCLVRKITKKSSNEQSESNLPLVSVQDDDEINNIHILSSDYNELNLPEKNSLVYVCGYLLRKCREIHKDCLIFQSYIKPSSNQVIHNFSAGTRYLRYKDYSKNTSSSLLVIPPDDFVYYVAKMEKTLQSTFKEKQTNSKILMTIFQEINDINMSPFPCPCFPKNYLIKLFIRMRIYFIIKFNNKCFKSGRSKHFSVTNL